MARSAYATERLTAIRGKPPRTVKPAMAPEPLVEGPPAEVPVFDPERLAVQTYSAEGGQGFIQGKNHFSSSGKFIREMPEAQWYITTPEQEKNNRRARARQRQIFGRPAASTKTFEPAIPAKLLKDARENMQALAAERWAE